ncbi:MAG: segregation and condensation protein A [Gammaproteobacteria bacterium]
MSGQIPLALVYGEPVHEAPRALYIPPEAMRVMLDNFSGPLDLLLYLVRRHRFDILDIPAAALCRQYAEYVEEALRRENNLEIAADYLAMAALLVDIKSKMMLPKPQTEAAEEDDPRADLVRRLLEYERLRDAAQKIAAMPRRGRDFISPELGVEIPAAEKTKPVLHPAQLAAAFAAALSRARRIAPLRVWTRNVSLREIMSGVLRALSRARRLAFHRLVSRGLPGASFLAVLQLAAESTVSLHQDSPEDELFVELRGAKNESAGS